MEEVVDVMVHIDPEDDENVPQNTKLPLRSQFLPKLERAWADIEAAKQIENITLHYLQGKIEIELLLPLAILHNAESNAVNEVEKQFKQALAGVEEISKVSVNFH